MKKSRLCKKIIIIIIIIIIIKIKINSKVPLSFLFSEVARIDHLPRSHHARQSPKVVDPITYYDMYYVDLGYVRKILGPSTPKISPPPPQD